MPCDLTSNITIDCKDNMGGAAVVYFVEFPNVTAMAEVSGVITGMTLASGKVFRRYAQQKETAGFTDTINAAPENGTVFWQQELTIVVNKMQTATRNEIRLLGINQLVAVVKDMNGRFWVLGRRNGLDLTGGNGGTGIAVGDRNGWTLTFTAKEIEPANELSSAAAAALNLT